MRPEHLKAQPKPWYGGWWQIVKAGLVLAAMVGGYTALSRRKEHGDIETVALPEFLDSPYFAEEIDISLERKTAQRQLFSSSDSALPVSGQYPDIFELGNLNGFSGFKLDGEASGDDNGRSVSTAGDINGDGYADIIIGAYQHNNYAGRSYVVFGGSKVGSQGLLPLSSLNGINGFKLDGEASGDNSGWSVSTAGDMNGDGYADIIIGAPLYNVGRSYVVFGGSKVGSQGLLPLSSLNGVNGFKLDGEASGDYSGWSVSTVGDINGDGFADIIIGAPYYHNVGCGYVVFGSSKVGSGLLPLSSLNGVNGFKLDGEVSGDNSGWSVSTTGDINGDGFTDIIIGARYHNNRAGRSYVVFGGSKVGSQGLLPLSSLNGANGFKLDGEAIEDNSGCSVSTAGDINADGYTDVLIGAFYHPYGNSGGPGRSYVVFGSRNVGSQGLLPLVSLNSYNGFKLDGEIDFDESGYSVSTAGDMNGDGYSDIIISAPHYSSFTGRSYVVFGSSSDFSLVNNQLTIHQTQTVLLTANDLNTTNSPFSAGGLWFTVSACQHGYFSTIDTPTQPITQFNQSQIWGKQIQFVQDGSAFTPSYNISVTCDAGLAAILLQSAAVTFIARPLLSCALTINQGQNLMMSAAFLNVTDYNPSDQIIFTMSQLNYGRFQLLPANNSILQFTQSQLLAGLVSFVQDGTPFAPTFDVSVSDPYFTLPPQPCTINFNAVPVLINNRLTIAPGETVVMGANELFASDDKTPTPALLFTVNNVTHGYFGFVGQPNLTLTHFSQLQIGIGEIEFVADGTDNSPAYTVVVTNALGLNSLPEKAQVTFKLPSETDNSSTVRNAIIGAIISGVIGLGFFALKFWINHKARQRFEKASAEGEGVGKQQAEFNKNVIRPIAKAILAQIRITGFMGYVSDQTMNDAISAISALVHELEQQGVNINLSSLNGTQQHRLLDVIARQTRRVLIPDSMCCSPSHLFCPEVTPTQIEDRVSKIAKAVKKSLEREGTAFMLEQELKTKVSRVSSLSAIGMESAIESDSVSKEDHTTLFAVKDLTARMKKVEGQLITITTSLNELKNSSSFSS